MLAECLNENSPHIGGHENKTTWFLEDIKTFYTRRIGQ